MYAFKALIALKSRAWRGSKARLRTSAAHAPPQPSGAGRWRCCTGRPEGWHGISAREAADRRRRSRADLMMTGAPNECRQKEGTRKHLRRQAEQLPLIRRHSIRRTWKTDYSSCRKVKITASAFIYRGQTHFVIRKMGKLQKGLPEVYLFFRHSSFKMAEKCTILISTS